MKKMLSLSLALCAGLLFGWEADMQNKKLQTGKNIVVLNEKNQWLLGLGSSNEQDTVLLKPELSNGEFILDTTEYFKKNVNGYISLNWVGPRTADFAKVPEGAKVSAKKNLAAIIGSPGLPAIQYCWQTAEGMTFARPHKTETRLDNGSIRITSTENTIPADASRVILRQIFTKPGIYKIRSLSVTVSD